MMDSQSNQEVDVGAAEPPDMEAESVNYAEMDPSGRYGRTDETLGRGAFKVVYKAFDTQEGTEVAWNQVRISELMCPREQDKEERDRLFAEIRVLKALKHKNIMSFYDSWYDAKTSTINFITELFTSGTLRQYRKKHKHVDDEVLKRWAFQILCGLVYLHGHNPPIIHRDLKCDNIFINGSDGVVKIGDLGLATMLRSRTAPQSVLGTPEFMAPELYEEEYDDRVDVYSYGMCLLELATMEYPYSECNNAAQIYRKVSLGVRPAGLQKISNRDLAEFINVCIGPREQRPRSRQLLKHPYFDSIRCSLATSKSEVHLLAGLAGADRSQVSSSTLDLHGLNLRSQSTNLESLNLQASGLGTAQAGAGVVLSGASSQASAGPSRTTSALTDLVGSGGPGSDQASLRSQRSNTSELAAAAILEEADALNNNHHAAPTENPVDIAAAAGKRTSTDQAETTHHRQIPVTAASVTGSPPGLSPLSSPTKNALSSPSGSEKGCRCEETDRHFTVVGKMMDERDRFSLRLRIREPSGTSSTVEFEFDLDTDTYGSVATEMVTDLGLSPDDAAAIATAIKDELCNLAAQMEGDVETRESLRRTSKALQEELKQSAAEHAENSLSSPPASPMHARFVAHNSSTATSKSPHGATSLSNHTSPIEGGSNTSSASKPPLPPGALAAPHIQELKSARASMDVGYVPPVYNNNTNADSNGVESTNGNSAVGDDSNLVPQQHRLIRSASADVMAQLNSAAKTAAAANQQAPSSASSSQNGDVFDRVGSGEAAGVMSPVGILSPAAAGQEKRIPLHKLFEHLEQGGGEGKAEDLPSTVMMSNGNTTTMFGGNNRPLVSQKSSPPSLAAAKAELRAAMNGNVNSNGNGNTDVSNIGEQMHSLRLTTQGTPSPDILSYHQQQVLGMRRSTTSCSSGSSSPPLDAGELGAAEDGSLLGARKQSFKDKEALRKQAAESMKAVELRSLDLLGGLGSTRATRGTPMAANKPCLVPNGGNNNSAAATVGVQSLSAPSGSSLLAASVNEPAPTTAAGIPTASDGPVAAALPNAVSNASISSSANGNGVLSNSSSFSSQ